MRYPTSRALQTNAHQTIALPKRRCLQSCRCCIPPTGFMSAQTTSAMLPTDVPAASPTPHQAILPAWASDITCSSLSSALGSSFGNVTSFQLTDPRELEQSEVCRLQVQLQPAQTLSLLLKRYHLKRLMARIPKPESKWRVTATSFINEFEFHRADRVLQHLQHFLEPAGGLPRVYHAFGRCSDTDWFDRQYDFLFEMLPPELFYQSNQLSLSEATATVRLLARFHAFFWRSNQAAESTAPPRTSDPDLQAQLEQQWAGLYPRGAWWRKQLRPSVKFERGPEVFTGLCAAFPEPHLFGALDTPEHHEAMKRISASVDEVSAALSDAPDRTLVHGDPKTSNIFFKRATPSSQDAPELTAFAIDYQWTGRAPSGLADLVYCLYGGVQHHVITCHEQVLVEEYKQELWTALKERGLEPEQEASRTWLDAHLAVETVAYAMTAVPQLLDGLSHEVCAENSGKYGWLTHEMDPACTALMCSRAFTAMQVIDQAGGVRQLLQLP